MFQYLNDLKDRGARIIIGDFYVASGKQVSNLVIKDNCILLYYTCKWGKGRWLNMATETKANVIIFMLALLRVGASQHFPIYLIFHTNSVEQ